MNKKNQVHETFAGWMMRQTYGWREGWMNLWVGEEQGRIQKCGKDLLNITSESSIKEAGSVFHSFSSCI